MIRSFQWDLARQVERLDWLIAQLPRYAEWGYHEVHLHLEDAVEYPSLPAVARRDAYSYKQFGRLVDAATRAGIKVVPIVNLLGHTQYLIKVPELRDLNELRAEDGSPLDRGQICPLHPRTLDVAEKLLRDMAPFCTAGKVHVGLDESFHLGKHPLSRQEVESIGLAAHFAKYVGRLNELTRSHGLQMGLWADMLYFLPDAIPLLPRNVTAYEWYYYAFKRWPRVELFNFAEVDIASPLRDRGLSLYGCPMNGVFRHEPLPHFRDRITNIVAWWRHARQIGAQGFLVSSWEPSRIALELTTAMDAAAATLWLEPHITDADEILARGFARMFPSRRSRARMRPHRRVDDRAYHRRWAQLALACDRYPFSGYPRWEINARWDTVSRREPVLSFRGEERYFAKLARQCTYENLPTSLRAAVEFRHYLAARDVFVRTVGRVPTVPRPGKGTASSRNSFRLTKAQQNAVAVYKTALRAGRRAARELWGLTRNARVVGPQEQIVIHDAERLKAWQRGEPVFGTGWQLCYQVWNFAPAAQLVGVEQRLPNGSWQVLQSCHTIEFQSAMARPRNGLIREHAASISWDGERPFPELRIFSRGIGEVKVGQVSLTDGRVQFMPEGNRAWQRLGRPAPRGGLPRFDRPVDAIGIALLEFTG